MARVSITISAIAGKKSAVIGQVNARFNDIARENLHRDAPHADKRSIAASVAAGGTATPEFAAEAALRGITPSALSALILSKPNAAAQRELRRQQIMAKIDAATTIDELQAILSQGI